MNILGREIKNGEAVVLKEDVMSEDNKSIKDRVFICVDGFGMLHETAGRAIYGFYESDGIQARIEGHWIDKKETEKLQEIRG